MAVKVAINGFGRIGRLLVRSAMEDPSIEFVAVNDLTDAETLSYLFNKDSVHGCLPEKKRSRVSGSSLVLAGKPARVFAEKDPAALPWKELGVDLVMECTGKFRKRDDAARHLAAGASHVILSAPGKDPDITVVMGVNHESYDPAKHNIISNASCTTNCLAPVVHVLLKEGFGVDEGLMTTVHSFTATQKTVDGPSRKDWKGGRSASINLIPSTTGAAKAVGLVLPEVKGKLTGMAFSVNPSYGMRRWQG